MKTAIFKFLALLVVAAMVVTPVSAKPAAVGNAVIGPVTDDTTTVPVPTTSKIGVSETGYYIVRLQEPALASYGGGIADFAATSPAVTGANKLDFRSQSVINYATYLNVRQDNLLASAQTALGRSINVAYRYTNVLNALALEVSHAEALQLAELPGVLAVYPDTLREMDTDIGPTWIGAPSIWAGDTATGVDTKGEGILIGVIDSGVNHAHPSFADPGEDGYVYTNPFGAGVYHGVCAPSDPNYIPGFCNEKVVSAFSFYPGVVSPEDLDGHGSHTASTAGGNTHVVTLTVGTSEIVRTISGVAPHANLAIYKVCSPSCPGSASIAAVNQGLIDGVDVFNYSISGGDDPWNDPVDLAFLDATNAGVFVSASAGNAGPTPNTVAHTGPWNAAVAMSTHSRIVANSLDVTNPFTDTLQGLAALQGSGPQLTGDITREIAYDPTNVSGCTAFPANYFLNKIAMVQRGTCNFSVKVNNATTAGAVAVVIFNNRSGPPSAMSVPGTTVPSVMVGLEDGLALASYIDDNAPVTARLNAAANVVINPAFGDIVDSGSSRGPSDWELLKPDYAAPGVNILAAVAAAGGDPVQYGFYGGTSMAAPHSAGSAALLIALNPTLSPSEIKSLLTTSTKPWTEMLAATASGTFPANPFDTGSGRVDLTNASMVGLVFNETYANYLAADPTLGGDPKMLNQPSLVNYNCVGSCSWERTVKNILTIPATYTATWVTSVPTLTVTVNPSVFTLNPGAEITLEFTANTSGLPAGTPVFGDVWFDTDSTFPGAGSATLLSENFDSVTAPAIPANWAYVPVYWPSGGEPRWFTNVGTSSPTGGGSVSAPNVAYFNSYDVVSPKSARLYYTDTVNLTGYDNAGVSFWMFHDTGYPTSNDSVQVQVSTDGGTVWENVGSPVIRDDGTTGWRQEVVDLSAYIPQGNVMIGFLGISGFGNDCHIDDVVVSGLSSGTPVTDQHMTGIIVPADAFVPSLVEIDTQWRSGSEPVNGLQVASEVVTLTASVDGLVAGDMVKALVAQDPTNGSPYNGDGGTLVHLFNVPAGTERLVVQIVETPSQDVDLYVGTGSTPSAATEECASATGAILEYCEIVNPVPGDYWALAQNWLSSAPGVEDNITMAVGIVTPGDAANLTISGPSGVPAGTPFDISVDWDEPALQDGEMWYALVTLGTSPATPDDIGTMAVNLHYTQPVLVSKDAPATAETGQVIPYTIVLDGKGNPIDGLAILTDTLPVGVEYAGGITTTYGTAWYDEGANAVYWNNAAGLAAKTGASTEQKATLAVETASLKSTSPQSVALPAETQALTANQLTLLSEGFESGGLPAGWSVFTYSDSTRKWTLTTNPAYVHSGTYAGWVNYDSVESQDEWLVSPVITVPGNAITATLGFWAISDTEYPGATMTVYAIEASGAYTDTLWDLIADEDWPTWGYRLISLDLTSYANENIQLVWRYHGLDGESFGLDDIGVVAELPPPPSEVTVSFNVTVTAESGTITNIAALDYEIDTFEASADTVVDNPTADLSIVKAGPETVFTGDTFTYTLSVSNAGPDDATGVTVVDTLPVSVTFVSASVGCAEDNGVVICDVGDLALNETLELTIVVTAPATAGELTNVAEVSGIEVEPNTADNVDTAVTTVVTPATPIVNLGIVKAGPGTAYTGDTITYTISVSNAGPDDATGVTVVDTLPTGVTFVSASAGCTEDSGVVTCVVGELAVDETADITIVVIAPATAGEITNVAEVSANEDDSETGNNTDSTVTNVTVMEPTVFKVYLPLIAK